MDDLISAETRLESGSDRTSPTEPEILGALRRLDGQERLFVGLYVIFGLETDEIAAVLDLELERAENIFVSGFSRLERLIQRRRAIRERSRGRRS